MHFSALLIDLYKKIKVTCIAFYEAIDLWKTLISLNDLFWFLFLLNFYSEDLRVSFLGLFSSWSALDWICIDTPVLYHW